MSVDLAARVRELEAALAVLQNENDLLADRAEETLLVRLVGEAVHGNGSEASILESVLESLSILLNIPYCAVFVERGESFELFTEYVAFTHALEPPRVLDIAPEVRAELKDGPWMGGTDADGRAQVRVSFGAADFRPRTALLLSFSTGALGSALLVCLRDEPDAEGSWPETGLLLALTERIRDRLDNLYYLREMERLNAELESRVAERTRELYEATTRLQQEIDRSRRAQRHLERLAMAIDQAWETIVITDTDGCITYVNPAFERITGYSRDEALGQNPRVLSSGRHDPAFYREMWSTITHGRTWTGHFINRRKDGGLFTEEATISPVHDPSGKIISYVAVKRDITEQIELEGQLRQSRKMESVGQLAGSVAHDFNNFLTPILGFTELLLASHAPDDAEYQDLLQIKDSAERARDLTQQILAFSRKQVLETKPLDLAEVVSGFAKGLRAAIREDIQVEILLPTALQSMIGDLSQIQQILMNLVVNAQDAMPDGGTLTISASAVEADDAYGSRYPGVEPGSWVRLEVTDQGVGMGRDVIERVFDPFFTTKATGKGTGLGLATVHGIVAQHGGKISVASEPGRGTTFTIHFPQADTEPGPEVDGRDTHAHAPLRGTERILVVEDDRAVRYLTRRILEECGYEVLEADGAEECERLLDGQGAPVDLLLTDVVMPGVNGRDLYERLRPRFPALRVVYMSGYSDEVIAHRGVLDPDVILVKKPLTMDALSRTVRTALDRPSPPATA